MNRNGEFSRLDYAFFFFATKRKKNYIKHGANWNLWENECDIDK